MGKAFMVGPFIVANHSAVVLKKRPTQGQNLHGRTIYRDRTLYHRASRSDRLKGGAFMVGPFIVADHSTVMFKEATDSRAVPSWMGRLS